MKSKKLVVRVKRHPGTEPLVHRNLKSRRVQSAISLYQIKQRTPKLTCPLTILHSGIAKKILLDASAEQKRCAAKYQHRKPSKIHPYKILHGQRNEGEVHHNLFNF